MGALWSWEGNPQSRPSQQSETERNVEERRERKFSLAQNPADSQAVFHLFFFLMWTIFKVFIEFVTVLLLFYVLVFGLEVFGILTPMTRA